MNWVLVVSGDDTFQQRSMAAIGSSNKAVGAITDSSARRLVGSLRPDTVIVDGGDDEGMSFLLALRLLPASARPQAIVVGGTPAPGIRCGSANSLEDAVASLSPSAV